MHIVRLMNNLVKGPKKNDDKSAVAMLKKNDWHENVWQPVVNRDKSHERSGRPDINRDTCHELKRGPTGRRSSNAPQLGCVFHDMMPPKSILRKSSDMQKPIQHVKFTKAIARHTKIRDQKTSLGYICPGEPHQRSPNAPKIEDRRHPCSPELSSNSRASSSLPFTATSDTVTLTLSSQWLFFAMFFFFF